MAKSTGPYAPGATLKLVVNSAVWSVNKVSAYPYQIKITYSDGTEEEIQINNDNVRKYFPCLTPITVNDLKTVLATNDNAEENECDDKNAGDFAFNKILPQSRAGNYRNNGVNKLWQAN